MQLACQESSDASTVNRDLIPCPARSPYLMAESERPDEDLIESTLHGDDSAFEQLMRRYSGPVRNLIARYLRNRSMVDDLAQETFVKAYFGLSSFRGECPFLYWLKRIAVRLCLDEMRHRKARRIEQEDALDPDKEAPDRPAFDPEKQLEARLLLNKWLPALPPLDRMIVVLLYGEGYEVKEIARLTGLSHANVKVRAFRIRRRLKKLLEGSQA